MSAIERMGEALFALSDRLRADGFLERDAVNWATYESVVSAWTALTAASAIEARSVETEGLDPKDESAVP